MERLKKLDIKELEKKTHDVSMDMLEVCMSNGAGHIAPSLSCGHILVALYYHVMNIYQNSEHENRDRLIFSKAHGCYVLYSILSDIGYIPREEWVHFYKNESRLSGCVERNVKFGIEAGCGSLGHGLPMATGIAMGAKMQNKDYQVYCIVGDGEMQEGSNWEAIQFAVKYRLDNLVIIIDTNRLQAMDVINDVLVNREISVDLEEKSKAFGCQVLSCDGHSHIDIINNLMKRKKIGSPCVLIANTIKGHGLKCMENIAKFHFRLPTVEDLKQGGIYQK